MDYKSAGVNIEAGNQAVNRIKSLVESTYTPQVQSSLGGFAAGFKLDTTNFKEPILVSCTDGVGTKLRVAIECNIFDTVGIDLVAMSVNDLVCMGAQPLFFLDYYACHELIPDQTEALIKGMTKACIESGCSLVGGEMAEMNDMYKKGDFDLAGFCVGVVDKPNIIDGSKIKAGDKVYAFKSSGFHSNGFSLVRKVLTQQVCEKKGIAYESLLEPTKLYVKPVLDLVNQFAIHGLCHITGGGLAENIERVLPEGVQVTINKSAIRPVEIFEKIKKIGSISESELYKVFNMGIGMIVITPETLAETEDFYKVGTVACGQGVILG